MNFKLNQCDNAFLPVIVQCIVLFHHITSTACFLDTFKDSWDGIKSYAEEIIPYVQKGVKMVQRAENFVDSAIGEDCSYECENPAYEPIPRSGHIQTSNGCGSFDFIFDDSEESLIHVEKEFIACCNDHDLCYDTCNMDKDDCDLKFKRCLYGYCKKSDKKKKYLNYFNSQKCKLKAKVFYIAVVGVGCQAYRDAQRNSCKCVKLIEKPRNKKSYTKEEL